MESDYLLIALFLLLSAFFSGSETAFFSLSKLYVRKLENSKDISQRRIFRLMKNPHELLITILLGNTIVNVAATALATGITLRLAEKHFPGSNYYQLFITAEIIFMTVLLLIFGEISPKLFAFAKAHRFAPIAGIFLEIFKFALFPLIKLLAVISNVFSHRKFTDVPEDTQVTSAELHNLFVSDNNVHDLQENEKQLIDGIFKFSSIEAREIMSPRVDMTAVPTDMGLEDIKKEIAESGHSRIPVYADNIDNIKGTIFAKDILLNPDKTVQELLRKPIYVPENINIHTLLNQFKTTRIHIAMVVDEYGGTSGLITLEDILEELVGEILDEYDDEDPQIKEITPHSYELSGMYQISDLNSKFDFDIDTDQYDNLASFLYDIFNKVPELNEKISYTERAVFHIKEIEGQRIQTVILSLINENN